MCVLSREEFLLLGGRAGEKGHLFVHALLKDSVRLLWPIPQVDVPRSVVALIALIDSDVPRQDEASAVT